MAFLNWLWIHHGNRSRRGGMHSGRRGIGVGGSPCVSPRPRFD